jgi:NAD(P)-dependent dehydrogenase (short-subunit alcohol dehydrogenase family)
MVNRPVNWEELYNGKVRGKLGTYCESKYANVLFSEELQARFNKNNIQCKAVSLHPGVVRTEIYHKGNRHSLYVFAI